VVWKCYLGLGWRGLAGIECWRERVNEDGFDPGDIDKMMERLESLRSRHRELDQEIDTLESAGGQDIKIMGLKREKLRLKDHIAWLSSKIMPDIIA
jgi:hypothetical protein